MGVGVLGGVDEEVEDGADEDGDTLEELPETEADEDDDEDDELED